MSHRLYFLQLGETWSVSNCNFLKPQLLAGSNRRLSVLRSRWWPRDLFLQLKVKLLTWTDESMSFEWWVIPKKSAAIQMTTFFSMPFIFEFVPLNSSACGLLWGRSMVLKLVRHQSPRKIPKLGPNWWGDLVIELTIKAMALAIPWSSRTPKKGWQNRHKHSFHMRTSGLQTSWTDCCYASHMAYACICQTKLARRTVPMARESNIKIGI